MAALIADAYGGGHHTFCKWNMHIADTAQAISDLSILLEGNLEVCRAWIGKTGFPRSCKKA
jgi:hypothetical protein